MTEGTNRAETPPRHPVYPGGPDCSPSCPGPWSQYHDGYATGYEDAEGRGDSPDHDGLLRNYPNPALRGATPEAPAPTMTVEMDERNPYLLPGPARDTGRTELPDQDLLAALVSALLTLHDSRRDLMGEAFEEFDNLMTELRTAARGRGAVSPGGEGEL